MEEMIPVHDVTTGISKAVALRERYQSEAFGSETGFERRDLTEKTDPRPQKDFQCSGVRCAFSQTHLLSRNGAAYSLGDLCPRREAGNCFLLESSPN